MQVDDSWQIGVDMADHDKFNRFNTQDYPHFYDRVFTAREREFSQNKIVKYAGIFAAKEAIYKAVSVFGTTYLSQFEIDHDIQGQPQIRDRKHGDLPPNHLMVGNNFVAVKVSISHSRSQSIAFALAKLRDD